MKLSRNLAWFALVLGLFAAGSCDDDDSNPIGVTTVTGSGTLASEDRVVGAFTRVTMGSEGSVEITQGAPISVSVEAEDNLLEYLLSATQGGELRITTQSGIDIIPTRPIVWSITVPDLDAVSLSGVADIDVSDFTIDDLSVSLTGVGDVNVTNLDAQELEVVLSGVGDVTATGSVDTQTVTISGVGDYEGEGLASLDATVTTSGEGSAYVRVSDTLTATLTGVGSIFYYGNPTTVIPDDTGVGDIVNSGP
jgi:hypothetical protein